MTSQSSDSAATVWELLGAGEPADPAIVTAEGSVLTYAVLRSEVRRLASQLQAAGLGAHDRIAIMLPNGPEMAIAFLAAIVTGCAAPLNPKYRPSELSFYLDDLAAKALITRCDNSGEAVRQAASETRTMAITLSGDASAGACSMQFEMDQGPAASARHVAPGTFKASEHGAPVATEASEYTAPGATEASKHAAPVAPVASKHAALSAGFASTAHKPAGDDVALVLHTSGTTSRPKIVPLRQRNLACSAAAIAESLALTPRDRSLNVMPLFHIHGLLAGLLAPLSVGASVACTQGFDAFRFFAQLEALRATYYTAVPTMHQMVIARSSRHRELARRVGLRFVRSSSASLPAPVLHELADLFAAPVIEAYGMTEATHQMCSNPLPPAVAKVRSVGVPSGIELAILDSDGTPLTTPGERGEVSVKGPTVIDGYENNPTADEAAFTSGWFRTGDEGYLDEDGYLYLTGRLKEQINRGGEKISPMEVDEALLRHPSVAEAVSFAVPHLKLGEDVAAAVVAAPGATPDERQLRSFLAESLAAFKVPRRVLVLDELPKGPTGKLQRLEMSRLLGLVVTDEPPGQDT